MVSKGVTISILNQNRSKLSHNLELRSKKWDRRCCHAAMSRPVGLPSGKKHTRVEVLRFNLLV